MTGRSWCSLVRARAKQPRSSNLLRGANRWAVRRGSPGADFGRRAAGEVRDRIAARIGGGLLPTVATFHSFAYGLVRAHAGAEQYADPPRLLSGAEEDQRIRELIMGSLEDGTIAWPQELQEAIAAWFRRRGARPHRTHARARHHPARLRALAAEHARPEWNAVADIAEQEEDVMVLHNVMDYAELMRRACSWPAMNRCAANYTSASPRFTSTSSKTPTPSGRVPASPSRTGMLGGGCR